MMSEKETNNKMNKSIYASNSSYLWDLLTIIYLLWLSQAWLRVFLNKYYNQRRSYLCKFQHRQRYSSQMVKLYHVYLWRFNLSNLKMWQLLWRSLSIIQPIARQNSKHSIRCLLLLFRSRYSWVSHQFDSIKWFQGHLKLCFHESKEQSNWR